MPTLESVGVAQVRDWCKERSIFSIRVDHSGWPDRLYVMPRGIHVWIEHKQAGKKPTKRQQHRLRQLQLMGCHAYYADDPTKAINILRHYYEKDRSDICHPESP